MERLLSSMLIVNDNGYKLCFHHNALSAIKSVFEVKNFLSQWVFSHHTIQYDQYLLTKCVVDAAKNYTGETDSDKALGILFNPNTYLQRSDLEEAKIAMLCDDDLVYLIKQFANEKLSHEWLYRQYSMIPLWKSYAEFTYIFERVSIECDKRMIERSLQNIR